LSVAQVGLEFLQAYPIVIENIKQAVIIMRTDTVAIILRNMTVMLTDTFGTEFYYLFLRDVIATYLTARAAHLPAPVQQSFLEIHRIAVVTIGAMDDLATVHFGLIDD